MKLCSSRNPNLRSTWKEAVLRGIAPDGGLFIPTSLPRFSQDELGALRGLSFTEVAESLTRHFIGDEVSPDQIRKICQLAWDFSPKLRQIDDTTHMLELFHGPTCAFKDFGARFMAGLFRYFWGFTDKKLTVLVATSGDTGSAVANAFFDASPEAPIRVAILYPRNKVSDIQRKQMTTLGHNVTAYEVNGSFDDCQTLVKQALQDSELLSTRPLTSANSINIARLLPQMFYYAHSVLCLPRSVPPTIVVPSGNLGNITGALLAHLCAFTTHRCIAACNTNSTFPDFLTSGSYTPQPSKETISNAMDVGAPSNFFRINALMGQPTEEIIADPKSSQMQIISGYSASEDETKEAMRTYYTKYGLLLDPHTAVGAAALKAYRTKNSGSNEPCILVATAHPAKFGATVQAAVGITPPLPEQLETVLNKPEYVTSISTEYSSLRQRL